jgi:hypothetical protein
MIGSKVIALERARQLQVETTPHQAVAYFLAHGSILETTGYSARPHIQYLIFFFGIL